MVRCGLAWLALPDVFCVCAVASLGVAGWLMGKQSKKSRGGSIVSEAMTVKSVTSAAKTLIAAARFVAAPHRGCPCLGKIRENSAGRRIVLES